MNWINAFEILCYIITAILLICLIVQLARRRSVLKAKRETDRTALVFWAAMYIYCLAALFSLGVFQAVPLYGVVSVLLALGTLALGAV